MTAQYDPKGGPTVYATIKPAPNERKVRVNGRQVDLGAWVGLWAAGGLLVGPILGGLYLLALCKGWI